MSNLTTTIDLYEQKRLIYKPDKIKVLFVGESRPAGGNFFILLTRIFTIIQKMHSTILQVAHLRLIASKNVVVGYMIYVNNQ